MTLDAKLAEMLDLEVPFSELVTVDYKDWYDLISALQAVLATPFKPNPTDALDTGFNLALSEIRTTIERKMNGR